MVLINAITRKIAHKFTHKAAQNLSARGYKQFCKALAQPQAVQREKLSSLLKVIAPSVSGKKYIYRVRYFMKSLFIKSQSLNTVIGLNKLTKRGLVVVKS